MIISLRSASAAAYLDVRECAAHSCGLWHMEGRDEPHGPTRQHRSNGGDVAEPAAAGLCAGA